MTRAAIPVSPRALAQRVFRRLMKEGKLVRVDRGSGETFVVDTKLNEIVGFITDTEAYARELGVMDPWEKVEVTRK